MGRLHSLMCDEHNCGREYGQMFDNPTILCDLATDEGWRVEDDRVTCPSCNQRLYANQAMPIQPQGHPCLRCGRAIFMATIQNKTTYWNAAPSTRGNPINYPKSHPQRIVMDNQYYRKDSTLPPQPVFTSHRCRQRDVQTWQEQRRAAIIAAESKNASTTSTSNLTITSSWYQSTPVTYVSTGSLGTSSGGLPALHP